MNIVITGPRSVGKTTISKLVAKKLKLKYISSDEIGHNATKKYGGLDKAIKSGKIREFIKEKGYTLINDVFKKENNYVFDLSGGAFTYPHFPEASAEVRRNARKKSKVIGLLPSKDYIGSVIHLFRREINREHFKDSNKISLFWRTFLRHRRFVRIFKTYTDFIIYTKGKTPNQISEEIIARLGRFS